MIKLFFYLLILVYPFYLFVFTKDDLLFNRIWGAIILVYIFGHVIFELLKIKKSKPNPFFTVAFFLFLTISLSTFVNGRFNFDDIYQIIKLPTVFFVTSLLYQYITIEKKTLKIIYYLSFIYLVIFTLVILLRITTYNIDIAEIIRYRDEIWFNRPVIFALFYASFLFLFIYLSYIFNKNKYLKYIFFLLFFILGARSVLFGSIVILLTLLFIDFTKLSAKFIKITTTLLIIISFLFIYSNFDEFYTQNETLRKIIGSERDNILDEKDDFSIYTFSSGRLDIINFYIKEFEAYKFFFGEGGFNQNIRIGTHNELLDYFFMYGIFALISYFWFYIYKILFVQLLGKNIINRKFDTLIFGFVLFALLQSLTNPFTPTLSTIYFFIIFVIHLKIGKQAIISNENTNHTKRA